jgi:flagellar basal-body rod protein FlgC
VSLFGAMNISASGVDASQTWINTTAGNIANMNDAVPTSQAAYGEQTPIFATVPGSPGQGDGVSVASVQEGSTAGTIEYDPSSPLADGNGDVRMPAVDLASQMVQLIQAQSNYQANVTAIARATTAYQSALTLGS